MKNPSNPPTIDLEKVAHENLIPAGDPWLQVLFSADDLHSLLKLGIADMDRLVYGLYRNRDKEGLPWKDLVGPIEAQLYNCGYQAVLGGHQYASSFSVDLTKTAQVLDWDYRRDIEDMISGMGYPASKKTMDIVHASLTGGEAPPIHELNQFMAFEQAKAIARTVMMNIYVKSSLRKWQEDGITTVKRMEMRDKKTCPICKALNGKEYEVDDLVNLVFPLTNDSHPSCRGTFIPIISLDTYDPKVRAIPLAVDLVVNGNTAKNVPIEIKPLLRSFLKRLETPIAVEFDPTISESYTWSPFEVTINPEALEDEDVREIILQTIAEQIWPDFEDKFITEYLPMIQSGLARPAKSFSSNKDLFINNYISHRMGQDPDAFSNAWWKQNVK